MVEQRPCCASSMLSRRPDAARSSSRGKCTTRVRLCDLRPTFGLRYHFTKARLQEARLHLANIGLRSWLQERIGNIFDIFDLGAFHPVREMERRALAETADYIQTNMAEATGYY